MDSNHDHDQQDGDHNHDHDHDHDHGHDHDHEDILPKGVISNNFCFKKGQEDSIA